MLPGPEAQQLATYLGWRLHGWRGGVAAGVLFVLPAVFILCGLSWLYMAGGQSGWLAGIFGGLVPAVVAVIFAALWRIGSKTLRSASLWMIAALSFIAIYHFNVSFIFIVCAAALLGGLGYSFFENQFPTGAGHGGDGEGKDEEEYVRLPDAPRGTWRRAVVVVVTCVVLWSLPILVLGLWLGWNSLPVSQGLFFSKAAVVTFGGAYAVLPYVAQQAVENYGWLSHAQMMSGLALAETTPGPLVIVLQFVGFAGGWQHPGGFSPLVAATLGAAITTWVTFVPCFLFVFLGAPYVERLRERPRVGACLTAITASVVGVILNLGVKFSAHALWDGAGGKVDFFALLVALVSFVLLWRFRVSFVAVLVGCALLGLVRSWI